MSAAETMIGEGLITRRDVEFVGPDRHLMELVAQRQALAPAQLQAFATGTRRNNKEALKQMYHKYYDHDINTYFRENNLTLHEPHFMVVRMMKYLIYGVQKRMKDFQRIVAKYEKDDRLRIGYIIGELDQWQKKMLDMISYVMDRGVGIDMRVRVHLLYYQRFCQTNADISYTTELLAQEQELYERARERAVYKQSGITSEQSKNFRQLQGALQHYQGVNLTQHQLLAIEKNLEASGIKYF